MIRHFLILVVVTLLAFLLKPFLHIGLNGLLTAYHFLVQYLGQIFMGGSLGTLLKQLIAVLIVTFGIGVLGGGVYWMVRRSNMPYLVTLIWVLWIIMMTAIVIA